MADFLAIRGPTREHFKPDSEQNTLKATKERPSPAVLVVFAGPHKRSFLLRPICLAFLLWLLGASLLPSVHAQAPPGRPNLALPYRAGEAYVVSCGYGCYQHRRSMTYAVDLDMPAGTPVTAAADGVVSAITWEAGLPANKHLGDALIVYVDHGNGWFTRYVHLDGITVEVGQVVRQGEIIGYVGSTGAEHPHLHFELKYGQSLHAPSQPIDDLFGGAPPEVGRAYESRTATSALPPTTASVPRLVTPTPTPTASAPLVLDQALRLSTATTAVGTTVTVSFALRNTSNEPLVLGLVGLAARNEKGALVSETLVVERNVRLNPGQRLEIERETRPLLSPGTLSFFVFAFTPDLEPLPLPAEGHALLRVTGGYRLFLPLVTQ